MKMLPYDNALKLIEEGDFGTYKLFALPGQEPVASSHTGEDAKDKKLTAKDLIDDLNRKIELLGEGAYMIYLKKAMQSQDSSKIVMRFQYGEESSASTKQSQAVNLAGLHGMTQNSLEDLIQKRVDQAILIEKEKHELKNQMSELLHKMKDLESAKRRRPVKNQLGFLNGLVDIAKIGAVTFIAERYPNSIEAVKETLKTMRVGEEEEEEEEEETTGFKRPEGE